MSSSLVRKALALYDEDLSFTLGSGSRKTNANSSCSNKVQKLGSKKRRKKKKNLIEVYREKQNMTYTEKNLKLLEDIAENKESSKEMLRKIVLKSGKCSSKKLLQQKKNQPKPKKTVFDESDFKKFEQEYLS